MGISGPRSGLQQCPHGQALGNRARTGMAGTVIGSAHLTRALALANEVASANTASLLVVDSFPPLGLMPNDAILHTNALRNALKSLLDAMLEVQSVLQHRDALDVAVVCSEGGDQPFESGMRIMHLIESSALRDARKKHSALSQIRLAMKGGKSFQGSTDCIAYASALFSKICSYARGLVDVRNASKLNVTIVTSCSVVGYWKEWMTAGTRGFEAVGSKLRVRFFEILPSREASFPHAGEGDCNTNFDCYEVPSYTASISWALKSVLGDSLESQACFQICGKDGLQMFCMNLTLRPRVFCTLGTAPLYNARVCLPQHITLDAVQRVSAQSLNEDLLLGVPHVVHAQMADGSGQIQLKNLIQGLQKRQELLLVEIDALGPFQARFGILLPSRTTECDVLLLREVACYQSIVPLGIWSGGMDNASGPCGGGEDADKAALKVLQAKFVPPVRRTST